MQRRAGGLKIPRCTLHRATARMAKLVDAWDLKSPVRKDVPVRPRLRAPNKSRACQTVQSAGPFCFFRNSKIISAIRSLRRRNLRAAPPADELLGHGNGRVPKLASRLSNAAGRRLGGQIPCHAFTKAPWPKISPRTAEGPRCSIPTLSAPLPGAMRRLGPPATVTWPVAPGASGRHCPLSCVPSFP